MKIAITGHNRGLGEAFYQYFGTSHQVVGFSISNGHDISTEEGRNKILAECDDIDVFVNNAWTPEDPAAQFDMLKAALAKFDGDRSKMIINISSRIVNYPNPEKLDAAQKFYYNSKIEQTNFIRERAKDMVDRYPTISEMFLGYVNTDMVSHRPGIKMEPIDVAKLILPLIEMKDIIHTPQITLIPGNQCTS